MKTVRKSTHGFPFLSYVSMRLRLAGLNYCIASTHLLMLDGKEAVSPPFDCYETKINQFNLQYHLNSKSDI